MYENGVTITESPRSTYGTLRLPQDVSLLAQAVLLLVAFCVEELSTEVTFVTLTSAERDAWIRVHIFREYSVCSSLALSAIEGGER
jgi:hypothetical protein